MNRLFAALGLLILLATPAGAVNLCSISGQVLKPDGTPDANDVVWFVPSPKTQVVGGNTVTASPVSTPTDANGNLTAISLIQGLVVQISFLGGSSAAVAGYVPLASTATIQAVLQVINNPSGGGSSGPLNSLVQPATGNYNIGGFEINNFGCPAGAGDALSESCGIGLITPGPIVDTSLISSTTTAGSLNLTTLSSVPQINAGFLGGPDNCTNYDHNYTLGGNVVITLNCSLSAVNQHIRYFITQPAIGGPYYYSFVGSMGVPVLWSGNGVPPIPALAAGATDAIDITYTAAGTYVALETVNSAGQPTVPVGGGGGGGGGCTGTCYYVDAVIGNNSNNGTTPATAWKTIGQVKTFMASPGFPAGATINFQGGQTWNEQLDIDNVVGTAASPITFTSFGTGQPIINGGATRQYCIDSINKTAKYAVFNNFECRNATIQGITFQTTGGQMPGLVFTNNYIHNSGPGCASGSGACLGTDPGGYDNQLDFEDTTGGADGVQMIGNIVKWTGGHNCLQVHQDTGASLVKGNTIGPGCVHGYIDEKSTGNSVTGKLAQVQNNVCQAGSATGLTNGSPCYYTENQIGSNLTARENISYQNNVAYDTAVGFQMCGGNCPVGSTCTITAKYYNNTTYVSSAGSAPNGRYSAFIVNTCGGPAYATPPTVNLRNNIFDGQTFNLSAGMTSCIEDYNNIGGAQHYSSVVRCGTSGIGSLGAHDQVNIDPLYVSASMGNFQLQAGSPEIHAGLAGLGLINDDIGAF